MKVSSVTTHTNFNGIKKIITKCNDGVVTGLFSHKGTDLGYDFVATNGDIYGSRWFSDGVYFVYTTAHIPTISPDLNSYIKLNIVNPQKRLKAIAALKQAKYIIDTEYIKKHPTIFTRKGLEKFLASHKKSAEVITK